MDFFARVFIPRLHFMYIYIYYAFERSSSIEFIIRDENFFKVTFFEITKPFKFFFFFSGISSFITTMRWSRST